MGLFALNPITFGRKIQAATNILLAKYTIATLTNEQSKMVLDKILEIESAVKRKEATLGDLKSLRGAEFYLYVAMSMMYLGIRPALGNELWFACKNPYMAALGVDDVMPFAKKQLEKKYGIQL